jgi:arginine repressor
MSKKPSINKSLEIRNAAKEMVSQGKPPRPSEIVEQLKIKGISVTGPQVSQALKNTEFALWKPRDPRALIAPTPTQALRQVSVEDLVKAKKFVEEIGNFEKAMTSVVVFGQFKEPDPKPEPEPEQEYYGGA